MSPPFRFQLISDLHLGTPLMSPSYSTFHLPIHAPNLFLLGDIGLTTHPQLFTFLTTLLHTHPTLRIFYILGNHEPYHTTLETSTATLSSFASKLLHVYCTQRFHFLNRTRIDLEANITILGCTLWTHIPPHCAPACAALLTDFSEENGIWERSVEQHNIDHAADLAWLNASVSAVPHGRRVVVVTHHSPTVDRRANHPRHAGGSANHGFRTDLSAEECWGSEKVGVWAFGHTHFSCQYYDGGKLMVANQKGYGRREGAVVVVEGGGEDGWRVVEGKKEQQVGGGTKARTADEGGSGVQLVATVDHEEKEKSTVKQDHEKKEPGETLAKPIRDSKWHTALFKLKNRLHNS